MFLKRSLFFLFIFSFCSAIIFLCIDRTNNLQQKKFTIVTTTSMLSDAVRIIVDDKALVYGLMGPGVDPHLYRARESDVHKLATADLIVYNGLYLEGKMSSMLAGMERFTNVCNAAQCLDVTQLRDADCCDMYDPHIWFNVSLWIEVVRYIQQQIIVCDPENTELYTKNGNDYIAQLEQLHMYIQQRVNEIPVEKRILVTAHDAFGYFGAAYGFSVVGLQGLSTDCDISTRDIQELADFIVEKNIPAIFVESSIPERTLIAVRNAVASRGHNVALGAELYSDALGDEHSGANSYIGMVTHNIDAIINSLKN